MGLLDIRTIAVIFFINCLVATLFMAALWQQSRRQFHGVSLWLTSFALLTAAFALISLRNVIPDIVTLLIANCCVVAAAFILYLGLEHFVSCPSSQRHNYIVLAVFVCLFTYFTFFQSNVAIRIILLNITLLVLFLQSCWLMLHRVGTQLKPLSRATGIVCLLYAVVACYRIILVIFTPTPGDFLDMDLWDATGLIISQILTIVLALVLLLMVNHRTLRNLFDQEEILIRSKVELEISNRDLTERMLAEEELKLNEEKYRNLFENAGEAIYVAQGGKLIFLNPQTSRMTGYPAKELMERQFTDFIHVDDRKLVIDRHMRRLRGEVLPGQYEFRIMHKSGSVKWAELNTVLITWEGKPATLNFLKDVTERRLAEKALQESEDRYRNIFNNAIAGIFQTTLEGRCLTVNPAFASMFGFASSEEMIATVSNVVEQFYVNPEDRKRMIAIISESEKTVRNFETQVKRKDGSLLWIALNARIIKNEKDSSHIIEGTCIDITPHKQAEAALRESEERWQFALEGSGDGLWDWHVPTNQLYFSPRWKALLGYGENEIGNTLDEWDKRLHPDDYQRVYNEIVRHFEGTTPSFACEYRLLCKDGNYRWMLGRGKIVKRTTDGQPLRVVGTQTDITENKHAEEQLKESEQRYRNIFENALVGIFQKIPGGRYISANPTFARMYGFDTPDELMSRIVNVKNEFYSSPQDYKLIKQQLDSAMVIKDFEAEGKRRDGTKIWLSICIRAVRDDRGKILYYEGTTVDITERKRAEEALRENEEKYRTVLDAIEEAYFELDLAGNLTFCNEYLCSSLGYSQEEILGTNYRIWVAEEDHEKAYKSFHQAYLTGSFKNVAFIMLRKDGARTYTECSTTSKRDSEGKVVGFRGVGHDITERKQVEQELENSRQVLRDLSARLINLREEERTLLAREIHDELGQALTALKMDLSWLSKKLPEGPGLLPGKIASMLNLVDTTAKMVKRISTELRPGLLDDLGLVAAMEWQAGEFQDRTGIKTELRFEPDDIVVNNEQATALFRIFQEALTNVARHAAATRINAYLHEKDGALELCVRDNGKGIEQIMINSPKSFGLIGVRERCYHLGGAVDIVGKKGKGTIITVNLPFRETKQ